MIADPLLNGLHPLDYGVNHCINDFIQGLILFDPLTSGRKILADGLCIIQHIHMDVAHNCAQDLKSAVTKFGDNISNDAKYVKESAQGVLQFF